MLPKLTGSLKDRMEKQVAPEEIKNVILDILTDTAPDADLTDLKDEINFRDQLELDSMDFLDIVM